MFLAHQPQHFARPPPHSLELARAWAIAHPAGDDGVILETARHVVWCLADLIATALKQTQSARRARNLSLFFFPIARPKRFHRYVFQPLLQVSVVSSISGERVLNFRSARSGSPSSRPSSYMLGRSPIRQRTRVHRPSTQAQVSFSTTRRYVSKLRIACALALTIETW